MTDVTSGKVHEAGRSSSVELSARFEREEGLAGDGGMKVMKNGVSSPSNGAELTLSVVFPRNICSSLLGGEGDALFNESVKAFLARRSLSLTNCPAETAFPAFGSDLFSLLVSFGEISVPCSNVPF